MRSLGEALGGFTRAPLLVGMASVMIGLALFVVGIFGVATHNLQLTLVDLEERIGVAVFLNDGATQDDIDEARTALLAIPGVTSVDFVSKEEALRRAQRDFPDFQEVFGSLAVNPLPRSLDVSVEGGQGSASVAETAWQTAVNFPFVEDADYGSDWVSNLTALRRIAGVGAAALGVAFALVAALITASAMRITIFARRDEIYVMRLVGARDGYIRRPFLVEGALVGLLGGLFAWGLTWAAYLGTHQFLFRIEWLPIEWVAGGLVAGLGLGMASSSMAVRGRLSGTEQ